MGWYPENKSYQRNWRPVSIADAARYSVSWSRRNEALDQLDDLIFEHQKIAAESARGRNVQASELKTRPQHGPLHTNYPAFPAARACVGLSAIAEFNAQAGSTNTLLQAAVRLAPELLAGLDPSGVQQASRFVVEGVTHRLCIDQLYRMERLGAVESYRLFACAMLDLRLRRLRDVVLAACTLGEPVFGLVKRKRIRQRLHPLTCRILNALAPACQKYQEATAHCKPEQLPALGGNLAKDLMTALLAFLPLNQTAPPAQAPQQGTVPRELLRTLGGVKRAPLRTGLQSLPDEQMLSRRILGVDQPAPPVIDEPFPWRLKPRRQEGGPPPNGNGQTQAMSEANPNGTNDRLQPPGPRTPEEALAQAVFQQATAMIAQATGGAQWDDPRVDQVANALRQALFTPGTVEAQLATHRHKVTAYGSGRQGTIHEEALTRCRQPESLRLLKQGAVLIAKKLRGYQWFGQRKEALVDRLQTRGALDPRRLPRLATSPLLWRRWQRRSVTDYRGRPIVILAKDGSSSNTLETTFAGKILAAAFLLIQKLARMRLFAADYSSDDRGFLVRWLYHPQKTPGRSPLQAVESVASLSPKGEGGNEDVLSISHIVHEAVHSPMAERQTIIVINITDGQFNSPIPEFRAMIRKLRDNYRLTYSLVILGDTPVTVPEADYTIRIPQTELKSAPQIAERIAKHVNEVVRTLRGKAKGRHG